LLLGTLCDRWFYGDWYCSPYQYFFANIIQQKAAGFGIEPWWYYFSSFIQLAIPPISVVLLVLLLMGAFKQKRNVFLWLLIPFVLAHSAVGHKELRFLFPMIFALMYLVALGLDAWMVSGKAVRFQRIVLFLCLLLNFPLLVGRSLIPAQETIAYHRFLYNHYEQPITLLGRGKDLYYIAELNANFYRSKQITSKAMENDAAIVAYLAEQKPERILLFEQELKDGSIQYPGYQRQRVYCLFPDWLLSMNFNNWQQRSRIWSLWELKAIPHS
jgi:phosphatidylinositol glycan class B